MQREERIRNRGSLVISRNDNNGHTRIGEPLQRLKRAKHETGLHLASIEHVTAVNDEIDFAAECRLERPLESREEVGQTEVSIGEKEDANVAADHAIKR